ncbi:hypothetical protein AAY473_022231 [Plecturocebus cupreus]
MAVILHTVPEAQRGNFQAYANSRVQVATLKILGIILDASLLLASHIHVLSSPVASTFRIALPSASPFLNHATTLGWSAVVLSWLTATSISWVQCDSDSDQEEKDGQDCQLADMCIIHVILNKVTYGRVRCAVTW